LAKTFSVAKHDGSNDDKDDMLADLDIILNILC